ncbi:hypothetical protein ACG873_15890 [Mesorhizobium sp. AaZ16]|uniref:hypothetical protein n=1 Tax=Mesorhizobium sp. AaZ16 TaxID=3402289 RepID=UPI00374F1176
MKTSSRHAALFLIAVLAAFAPPALAEEKTEALYEATLDLDRDGKMDRAVLVLVGPGRTDFHPLTEERYGLSPGERVDLNIYLAGGEEKLDLSRKPSFAKKAIADTDRTPWVQPLESDGDGSLAVTSVYGWGASKTWGETLTIAYRDGEFVVADYAKDWDWNTHTADGNVETVIGGCEIDFLAGKGVVTQGLDEENQPIEGTFTPVKLADWTGDILPGACEF